MARSIHTPPPTSSLARLLDPHAVHRATAALDAPATQVGALRHGQTTTPNAADSSEAALVKREVILSRATDGVFSALIDSYRRATGARVTASHVARAMLRGVAFCLPQLEQEAERIGRLKLPSNARGRDHERAGFEERLAAAFINGIRASAAYRWPNP